MLGNLVRQGYVRQIVRPLSLPLACALTVAACGGGEPAELLPDLDQAVPQAVSLSGRGFRYFLVFGSAVDNVGAGPMLVVGRRDGSAETMAVEQLVMREDGSERSYLTDAVMRYEEAESHAHWHLIGFERYELRRASDHALVAPSRKVGFCLGDRYETSREELPGEPAEPVWTEECGRGQPGLTTVREGISVGYGDDYVPALEGQYVDVTDLPPGRYELVHRANVDHALRESDYGNNAASVLLELEARSVRILARCPESERCSGT